MEFVESAVLVLTILPLPGLVRQLLSKVTVTFLEASMKEAI